MDNMLTQVTGNGVIKPLKGIILIVSLVAGFILLDMVLRFLVMYTGLSQTLGTIALYIIALAAFLIVLKRFCIVHMYTMDGVKLLLYRIYIRNPRFCEQILFRDCVYFGDPITAAKKFAISKTRSYTGHRDKYAAQSLVFKDGKKYCQVLMTPNEEVCAAILAAVRG